MTPRQRQVLELICDGKQNKVIAYELGLMTSTVAVHIRNLMKITGASNRTQMAVKALLKEGALLAANQCEGPMIGDNWGHFHCATVTKLRGVLKSIQYDLGEYGEAWSDAIIATVKKKIAAALEDKP